MKKLIIIALILIGAFTSCEPETCYTEITYYYPDGSIEVVVVEYECDNEYYYY